MSDAAPRSVLDGVPPLRPDGLPPLREVIKSHGLSARKALGQNFLLDLNLTGRIARAAGPLETGVTIEVGPGPGGLTRALLAQGAHVIAVERDPRCLAALKEIQAAYPERLEVIEDDALRLSLHEIGAPPRRIVANLPYNVATPLLLGWLRHADAFESLTLMFQKEVAARMTAAPGGGDYGRLSVVVQWLCRARPLFDIPPDAFTPRPKVTSTVVSLIPREEPLAPTRPETLERVTAAAFGQRRKMLRSSLKTLGDADALCRAAGLAPTLRAAEVPVTGFCALARTLDTMKNKNT